MGYKQKQNPINHVNSWEEEDVKRGRKLEKEGKKGHAQALFDDAHDSNRYRGGNDGSEPFHMSRELTDMPIDDGRMGNVTGGSWMSKHSKSALNYGSPLHAEKSKAEIKKDKQTEKAANKDTRQGNRAEAKTKRQGKRAADKQKFKGEAAAAKTASDAINTANKLERIENKQVRKDYRKAKSDVKDAGKKGDKYTTDSKTGVRTKNPKQKNASRKFVKDKATGILLDNLAAKKAAVRAKK